MKIKAKSIINVNNRIYDGDYPQDLNIPNDKIISIVQDFTVEFKPFPPARTVNVLIVTFIDNERRKVVVYKNDFKTLFEGENNWNKGLYQKRK